jgi:ABC-type branched-subunit amino acid transport system ATPase component/ABC-type branched-subunit amino acid transport system permease subunit
MMFGLTIPFSTLVQGVQSGIVFGLLSVGLVLVYQSSRIINFAHAEVGLVAAAVCELLVTRGDMSFWLSLPLALNIAAGISVLCELVVIRRLRSAPRVLSVVATLGLSQLVLFMTAALRGSATSTMPLPPWFPEFSIGPVFFNRAASAILIVGPLAVVGVWAMLTRSFAGRLIRAAAANPEAAKLAGLSPNKAAAIAWGTAGMLSGISAILVTGASGAASGALAGPSLLIPAIAAAVLGRFRSIGVAFGAAVALGILQQVVAVNSTSGGMVQLVTFGVILVGLLMQVSASSRDQEQSNWMAVAVATATPAVRSLRTALFALASLIVVGIGVTGSSETALNLSAIVAFALVAISVYVLTGLAGQLSLGQFAVAGVGAAIGTRVADSTGDVLLGLLAGGLCGAAVTIAISLPGIRLRGLFSAVTTLSFAVVARDWLLPQTWMIGSGLGIDNPSVLGIGLTTSRARFVFICLVFAVVALATARLAQSGIGRRMRALRDNEAQARGFSIAALRTRLSAFGGAGFIAGVGGVTFGLAITSFNSAAFSSSQSILVVAIAVVGGLRSVPGSMLGALYVVGLPRFVPLDDAGLAATSLGWLIVVMLFPQGLSGVIDTLLHRLIGSRASWRGSAVSPAAPVESTPAIAFGAEDKLVAGPPSVGAASGLLATGLAKAFGGVRAVDNVNFSVAPGETVSLIGANGAGKTTLFELIGGFSKPDAGTVTFSGASLDGQAPERRARHGVVRSFQDAQLFSTFTVREAILVALEAQHKTRLWAALLAPKRASAQQRAAAEELLNRFGLTRYADSTVGTLSTGTRRITELACMVALRPKLLLLDEPSAGIAQRETEALANVIKSIKAELNLTLVVVEHDIPFVRSLSDRIVVMETGKVIADGDPDDVLADPAVIESYLGNNQAAIARSGNEVVVPAEPAVGGAADGVAVDGVAVDGVAVDDASRIRSGSLAALAAPMRRRWASPTRAARTNSRKRVVGVRNRQLGWVTLPLLLAVTILTWAKPRWSEPDWLVPTTNNFFTACLVSHAIASMYLFGLPRPRARRQVVQVYLGYAVLLFTLSSQSLIGVEPIHSILIAPLWLLISAHVMFGLRNWWLRRDRTSKATSRTVTASTAAPTTDAAATVAARTVAARTSTAGARSAAARPADRSATSTGFGAFPLRFPPWVVGLMGLVVSVIGIVTTNRNLDLIKTGAAIMPAVFAGVICAHIFFIWQWSKLRRPSGLVSAPLVLLLLMGLITDNIALGLGNIIGQGDLLETLNRPRYWIHALLTPAGIIVALEVGARCGIEWCRRHRLVWWVFTAALMVFGVIYDGFGQELEFTVAGGATRYANEVLAGPPINAIATILVVLAVAVMLWQRGYRANMLGFAFIMLVGSAVGAIIPALGNVAECCFVVSLLAGMQAAAGHDRPAREVAVGSTSTVRIPWNAMSLVVVLGVISALHVASNVATDHGPSPAIIGALTIAGLLVVSAWVGAGAIGSGRSPALTAHARRLATVLLAADATLLSFGNAVGRVGWLEKLQSARIVMIPVAIGLLALVVVDLAATVFARPTLRSWQMPIAGLVAGMGIIAAATGTLAWRSPGKLLRYSGEGVATPGLVSLVALGLAGLVCGASLLRRSDGWPASVALTVFSALAVLGSLWGGPNSPLVFSLACGAMVGASIAAEATVVRTSPATATRRTVPA